RAWPRAEGVNDPKPGDPIHFEQCHLAGDGTLTALCSSKGDNPYGYGLARLDKDLKLLWGYSDTVHHDLDVGEDGRVYVLTQKISTAPAGPRGAAARPAAPYGRCARRTLAGGPAAGSGAACRSVRGDPLRRLPRPGGRTPARTARGRDRAGRAARRPDARQQR